MNDDAQVWQLVEGQGLLAELAVPHGDLAWVNPEIRAAGRFERVWPLSEEELG